MVITKTITIIRSIITTVILTITVMLIATVTAVVLVIVTVIVIITLPYQTMGSLSHDIDDDIIIKVQEHLDTAPTNSIYIHRG